MKATVFHAVGDIRIDDVPEPKLENDSDAIVAITESAICGTDLHMVRGTLGGMKPGTILGHEGVGIVEQVGKNVRNFKEGDRVVIPSTIACGSCAYCRAGYHAQCDLANPNGKRAGTAFFGGPESSGGFAGLQAEKARIPFANTGLVKIPDEVTDEQAILVSDIFPTGYFGAELAEVRPGRTVAVFGCGPVGQFAIASARLMDCGRIFAVDCEPSRLEMARSQGAEVIDFNREDPVEAILELTGGIGVDRAIDAVGVDANCPDSGPALQKAQAEREQHQEDLKAIFKQSGQSGDLSWHPGNAPMLALEWAVRSLAKAGTLAIIGVYPPAQVHFPLGEIMMKNLKLHMGNCHHRRYIPHLLQLVRTGAIDPSLVLTQEEPLTNVIDAYHRFAEHRPGWMKVALQTAA